MENQKKGKTVEIAHPLIIHKLTEMRKKDTPYYDFRRCLREITMMMVYELTRDLELKDIQIDTPVQPTTGKTIANPNITIVPVLRAGLGMVDPILEILPFAKVGHIGASRDEKTLEPKAYYDKMPDDVTKGHVIILDPMLATGNTLAYSIKLLKEKYEVKDIKVLCLLSCPEGIKSLHDRHPDVDVYVAKIDEKLNEKGYIVPGLGDAGDRLYGTKEKF
mmetsp:Transcript_24678/g.21847  ORF Transcript_24678/g.21847 Transcript_24678/m.21847 type:complete len:219 (+) Transcript_24678:97-753(+)